MKSARLVCKEVEFGVTRVATRQIASTTNRMRRRESSGGDPPESHTVRIPDTIRTRSHSRECPTWGATTSLSRWRRSFDLAWRHRQTICRTMKRPWHLERSVAASIDPPVAARLRHHGAGRHHDRFGHGLAAQGFGRAHGFSRDGGFGDPAHISWSPVRVMSRGAAYAIEERQHPRGSDADVLHVASPTKLSNASREARRTETIVRKGLRSKLSRGLLSDARAAYSDGNSDSSEHRRLLRGSRTSVDRPSEFRAAHAIKERQRPRWTSPIVARLRRSSDQLCLRLPSWTSEPDSCCTRTNRLARAAPI